MLQITWLRPLALALLLLGLICSPLTPVFAQTADDTSTTGTHNVFLPLISNDNAAYGGCSGAGGQSPHIAFALV